jgi:site-specific DNA-methyltransferase (adenine-specific)
MTIKLMLGNCLDKMQEIEDGSVDLVLVDPPYGTTACKWDSVIPFDVMWEQIKRVTKNKSAIVMTASQPFTSALIMSNVKMFKYCWVWEKSKASNFMLVKKAPLKNYEDVVVFCKESPVYNPQFTEGEAYEPRPGKKITEVYNPSKDHMYRNGSTGKRYPKAIQYFKTPESEGKTYHPTQKPVALMEYLIKTYSNVGDTVLDFTMGSGTTGVADKGLDRNFIGIELDETYFKIAEKRIAES